MTDDPLTTKSEWSPDDASAPGTSAVQWFRWVLLIGLLGLALVFAGPRLYDGFKRDRALRWVAEAEELYASGDVNGALDRLRLASSGAVLPLRGLRLSAKISSSRGEPKAVEEWRIVLADPGATREDLFAWLNDCLLWDQNAVVDEQVSRLLEDDPADLEALAFGVRSARGTGQLDVALARCEHWMRLRPESEEAQWNMGSLLIASGQPSRQAEGRRLLWSLVMSDSPWRDSAIRVLVGDVGMTRSENQMLLRRLGELHGTDVTQWDVQIKMDPDRRDEIFSEASSRLLIEADSKKLNDGISWLARRGAFEHLLVALPLERARDDERWLATHLQTLMEMGRADDALKLASDPSVNVDPSLLHLIRARGANLQGRVSDMNENLNSALIEARANPARLLRVAQYAQLCKSVRYAVLAHQELARVPDLAVESVRVIERLVFELDDMVLAHQVLRELPVQIPLSYEVQVYFAYLAVLLKNATEKHLAAVHRGIQLNPHMPFLHAVLALEKLQAGDTEGALESIEGPSLEWQNADPQSRAIYVAILGANEQRGAARELALTIPMESLKTREQELIQPWLR